MSVLYTYGLEDGMSPNIVRNFLDPSEIPLEELGILLDNLPQKFGNLRLAFEALI